MRFGDFILGVLIGRSLCGRSGTGRQKPATACQSYGSLVGLGFLIYAAMIILSAFGVVAYSVVNIAGYIWVGMIVIPLFFIILGGIFKFFKWLGKEKTKAPVIDETNYSSPEQSKDDNS